MPRPAGAGMLLLVTRSLLVASTAAAAPPSTVGAAPPFIRQASRVVVGAIRWDAYWGKPGMKSWDDKNFGVVTRTTTLDMSPAKWHYKVPFFAKEVNSTAITCDGDSKEVMGQELEYAATHGIDFWSFCNYPIGCVDMHPPERDCTGIQCCADNVGLSYAWNQYLAHPDNHRVNFTLLLQPGYWFPTALKGGNETLAQEIARYVSYFKMPNYQRVLGTRRPLVFLFGKKAVESDLQALRSATKAALGVYPYITSMNGQIIAGVIDAVSKYTYAAGKEGGAPYQTSIAQPEAKLWATTAAAGQKIIPTVSAGWDNRPRINTCPWGNGRSVLSLHIFQILSLAHLLSESSPNSPSIFFQL